MTDAQPRLIPFPTEVAIGPYRYAVKVVDFVVDRENQTDTELIGLVSTISETIEIGTVLTARGRFETFIHECLHAISDQIPGSCQLNEDQVQALSPHVTSLMYQLGGFEPMPLTPVEEAERVSLIELQKRAKAQAAANDVPETP